MPQTPWLVEGERKLTSSVQVCMSTPNNSFFKVPNQNIYSFCQEYIATPIQKGFKADNYNFSTSGREDVDVRMLGNGRPFLIELINARQSQMDSVQLAEIKEKINEQNKDVSVSGVQVYLHFCVNALGSI